MELSCFLDEIREVTWYCLKASGGRSVDGGVALEQV